jgi:hypothetical protein
MHGRQGNPNRTVDMVNIATDCPATATADGRLFTPFSGGFFATCAESLTWSQYVNIYGAMLRVKVRAASAWDSPLRRVAAGPGAGRPQRRSSSRFTAHAAMRHELFMAWRQFMARSGVGSDAA